MTSASFNRLAAGIVVGVLLIVAVGSSTAIVMRVKNSHARRPPAERQHVNGAPLLSSAGPIATEAPLWRAERAAYAIDARADRRRGAHPRTMATWRALRAFPGAPPRIPHGLTTDEALASGCNKCHERGDYAQRFGAYAPITPHSELQPCTQCHVPDAAVTGIAVQESATDTTARCRQCHSPETTLPMPRVASVPATAWPRISGRNEFGAPPPIPHDLALRGNCRSCHVGPGSVAEIRTSHPDRINCRQCHVTEERTQ